MSSESFLYVFFSFFMDFILRGLYSRGVIIMLDALQYLLFKNFN